MVRAGDSGKVNIAHSIRRVVRRRWMGARDQTSVELRRHSEVAISRELRSLGVKHPPRRRGAGFPTTRWQSRTDPGYRHSPLRGRRLLAWLFRDALAEE